MMLLPSVQHHTSFGALRLLRLEAAYGMRRLIILQIHILQSCLGYSMGADRRPKGLFTSAWVFAMTKRLPVEACSSSVV